MDIELVITGVGASLAGVGRAPDGRATFVPGALPGETVRARVMRTSDRYINARLLDVLCASPERAAPRCPLYGRCGGCQAQHMRYDNSLALKRQVVKDALERIGGQPGADVRPMIGMTDPWRYRNKAEYRIWREGGAYKIGASDEYGRGAVDIIDCPLQHPKSAEAIAVVRDWLDQTRPEGVRHLITRVGAQDALMIIVSGDAQSLSGASKLAAQAARIPGFSSLHYCALRKKPAHALDGACRLIAGEARLDEVLCGMTFSLSPQSFFQVNRVQAERLYAEALSAAQLSGRETVIDAYCGAGTISLCMARFAARVVGIELFPPAAADARDNARRNHLVGKTHFITGDAPTQIKKLVSEGLRPDVVVVDPPRKGLDEALIDAAHAVRPDRFVYVSCDAATLARDIKRLTEGGLYRMEYAQPVDMFGWTGHVETVVLMSRAKD